MSIKFKEPSLSVKITLLTAIVIFISLLISGAFSIWTEMETIKDYSEITVMNMAQSLARDYVVIESLKTKDSSRCQKYIRNIRSSLQNIRFITICDMESIRYAHPDPEKVGQKFVGGDNRRVLETGESYISVAVGTLGKSLRAFAPVLDSDNIQIGFVTTGTLIAHIDELKSQALSFSTAAFILSLSIGIMGSYVLSRNIKRTLLGLEPYEIIRLYNEKKGMLNAIHEGILAIDSNYKITMINQSALNILNVNTDVEKLIGKTITDIFPSTKLLEVMKTGTNQYNQEDMINQTLVVANRIVIKDGNRITGAIASFQDKTMLTLLAEEITGVNQVVGALRASNHEFKNKLHVILGFIHSGRYKNAENFIIDITEDQDQMVYSITKRIKNATLAALVIGKQSRSKELDINLIIDENSYLDADSYIYNNDLIIIVGNLIENSFDAIQRFPDSGTREVYFSIKQSPEEIRIVVRDTGTGIMEENLDDIFRRGYTTKTGSDGVGLDLVQRSIKNMNGSCNVFSRYRKGTEFNISLKLRGIK